MCNQALACDARKLHVEDAFKCRKMHLNLGKKPGAQDTSKSERNPLLGTRRGGVVLVALR